MGDEFDQMAAQKEAILRRQAEQIRDAVMANLIDRSGFDGWWYGIDADTRDEIDADIAGVILTHLKGN